MNKILWIDDIRIPSPDMECDIARTYDEAIRLLSIHNYHVLYLDHDLADFKEGTERTGYNIVLWLVQRKRDGFHVPDSYRFLTANPVGLANMIFLITRYLSDDVKMYQSKITS